MVKTRKHQNRFMKWVLVTAILFFGIGSSAFHKQLGMGDGKPTFKKLTGVIFLTNPKNALSFSWKALHFIIDVYCLIPPKNGWHLMIPAYPIKQMVDFQDFQSPHLAAISRNSASLRWTAAAFGFNKLSVSPKRTYASKTGENTTKRGGWGGDLIEVDFFEFLGL